MKRMFSGTAKALLIATCITALQAQPVATARFDTATIRPCKVNTNTGQSIRGGFGGITSSPGRLSADCAPLQSLIQHAYMVWAKDRFRDFNFFDVPIQGLPAWTKTEHYKIEAKSEAKPSQGVMNGTMFRALLEDRFQLKVRWQTQDAPVFELTVAKTGHKLTPFDGSCTPGKDCRNQGSGTGTNITRYWRAITVDDLIAAVLDKQSVGRPVINKTAIKGRFDIRLKFKPGPSIATALEEQLGLKLIPSRAREESLVIDRVARPTSN